MEMKVEEYEERIKQIDRDCDQQKKKLSIEFAKANCDIEIGDIVSNGNCCISVETRKVYPGIFGQCPEMVFRGTKLTKKMRPFKNGEHADVYQSCVIEHIKGEK
jgi:hypothetical protein